MNVTLFRLANYRLPAGLPVGFSASGVNSGVSFLPPFITTWGPGTVFRLQGKWKEAPFVKRVYPDGYILTASTLFDGMLVVTDSSIDASPLEDSLSGPSSLLQDFLFSDDGSYAEYPISGETYRGRVMPLPSWNSADLFSRGSRTLSIGNSALADGFKVALPSTTGGSITWGDISAFPMPNLSWLGDGLIGLIAQRVVPTIADPFVSVLLSDVMPLGMAADLPVPDLSSRYGKFDLRLSKVYSCALRAGSYVIQSVDNPDAAELGATTSSIQHALTHLPSLGATYISRDLLDYNLVIQVLDSKTKNSLSYVSGGFSDARWGDPFSVNIRGRSIPPCLWTIPCVSLRLSRAGSRYDMSLIFAAPLPTSDSVVQYRFDGDPEGVWSSLELNAAYPRVISKSWTNAWPNFQIGLGVMDDPDCIVDFSFD